MAPGVDVGMGYRYFDASETSFFAGKNSVADRHDNNSHTVLLNLTITTN